MESNGLVLRHSIQCLLYVDLLSVFRVKDQVSFLGHFIKQGAIHKQRGLIFSQFLFFFENLYQLFVKKDLYFSHRHSGGVANQNTLRKTFNRNK